MKHMLGALLALAFFAAPAAAQTIIPLNTLTLNSGANFSGGVINFTAFGGTATTTTLASLLTVGTNYTIEVTGTDGTGNRHFDVTYPAQGVVALDFGGGATLQFLIQGAEAGGQAVFTYSGNGDFQAATITRIAIVGLAVPAPLAGAGVPGLLAIAAAWYYWRRRWPRAA